MKTHHLILGVIAWIPFAIAKIVLALLGPLFCLFIEKDHRPDILFVYHGGIEIEDWWWNYEQQLAKGPVKVPIIEWCLLLGSIFCLIASGVFDKFWLLLLAITLSISFTIWVIKDFQGPKLTIRKKDLYLSKNVWLRTWWWYAIRNPVEGWKKIFKHPERFTEFNRWETFHGASNSPRPPVEPMESLPMLEAGITKWTRWRRSGWRLSYRKLVVPPTGEPQYREIYFGWKLGTSPPDLDFAMQYRKGRIGN